MPRGVQCRHPDSIPLRLFDLAVASDCTYKAELCDPLFATAARLLRPGGVLCLVHKHFCCPDAALEDAVARSPELEWISDADAPFMTGGWRRRSMINEAGNPREISVRVWRVLNGEVL